MTTPKRRVEVTLETEYESVDLAEDISLKVAEAAGFSDDDCHKIGMAVREAVINAVQYGNQLSRSKKIALTLELDKEKLIIQVEDEGAGFDLREVPDPLAEENLLKTSGRGIFLMRSFMDEFGVERGRRGGAEVTMSKRYTPPSGSGPARETRR